MSGVDARMASKVERDMLEARYAEAKASIEKNRLIENGQSGALLFAAMAYNDALEEFHLFKLASHWARLFCILAVFAIPNLLVIRFLIN